MEQTRDPAYGPAAERYNRERELGARVLEILRAIDDGKPRTDAQFATATVDALMAARALGLLDAKEVQP